MPDKKRDSKRKSEEVQVYTKADISSAKNETKQKTFKPRSFSFTKALEYKKVTKQVVAERIVHIEVCVSQKYTRKSYVIATWNSPLTSAVKQLLKTKYPLTPRLSTELPSSMKVYGSNHLHMSNINHTYSSSVPNSRTHSMSSLPNTAAERASSDSDLHFVTSETLKHVPSIEITVPSEDEDEVQLEDALYQIAVIESREEKSTSIRMGHHRDDSGSVPGMIELQELDDVTMDKQCKGSETTDVIVHVPDISHDIKVEQGMTTSGDNFNLSRKKEKSGSKQSKRFSFSRSTTKESKAIETKSGRKTPDGNIRKDRMLKRRSEILGEGEAPRPESPAWDTYAEPLKIIPIELELHEFSDSLSVDPNAAQLPMETRLEMLPKFHRNHEDNTIVEIDKFHRSTDRIGMTGKGKGTSRSSSNKTGKAIVHEV